MLDLGRHDMTALLPQGVGRAAEQHVVPFAASARKINILKGRVQQAGDPLPGLQDQARCFPAFLYTPDGLPYWRTMTSAMAAAISGRTRVVAALSK